MLPDISNNFSDAHVCSLLNATYLLVAWHSDIIDEVDAALMDLNGVFSGWVAQENNENILKQFKNERRLFAQMLNVEIFEWQTVEEIC